MNTIPTTDSLIKAAIRPDVLVGIIKHSPFFIIFALLSCLLITGLISFPFSPLDFNAKRVLLIVTVLPSLLFIIHQSFSGSQFRQDLSQRLSPIPPKVRAGLALIFILGTISSLLSAYPAKGLQEVGLYALLFCMTIVVSISRNNEQLIIPWLWVISIGLLFYTIGYFFQYILYLQFKPKAWMYSIHEYSNPRTFNHVQGWLIPLLALLPLFAKGVFKRLSWFGLSVLYFYLLVTSVRGLPLAMIASAFITLLAFKPQAKLLLKVHAKAFVFGGLAYLLLIQLVPLLLGHGLSDESILHRLDSGSSGRLHLWQVALDAFIKSPWLGIGPQHYITQGTGIGSPHNIILQWLSEWGGPAALLMIGLSVYGGVRYLLGVRQRIASETVSDHSALVQVAVFMSLLTSGLYAQLSGVFITPLSQVLLVVIVGSAISFHNQEVGVVRAPLHWLEKILWAVLLLFLLVTFYWVFYKEFYLGEYDLYLLWEMNAPRFWLNGDFTR